MTQEKQNQINALKAKVYDLIGTIEQYQQMIQKIQHQISEVNKQIAELESEKEPKGELKKAM